MDFEAPMNLEETVHLMNSDNYRERLIGEYYQVVLRRESLDKFIRDVENKRKNSNASIDLLVWQRETMLTYERVLERRLEAEGLADII